MKNLDKVAKIFTTRKDTIEEIAKLIGKDVRALKCVKALNEHVTEREILVALRAAKSAGLLK